MTGKFQGENPQSPRPLTGGVGDTQKKNKTQKTAVSRNLPLVALSTVKSDDFKLLVQGWDTVAETFDLHIPEILQIQLEAARQLAEDRDIRDNQDPELIGFGGEEIQINPRRPKRGKWSLANDDFQITFRSPKMDWCVTVRYSAGGLWEYGLDALRERVWEMLTRECQPKSKDCKRISEAHWCWDFHSPAFTAQMEPGLMKNVVCHSSTKKTNTTKTREIMLNEWGRGVYLETLTIGQGAPLTIQVYDKGKEITEASGKTWMLDLWARSGWKKEESSKISDVWRLEIRMRNKFLRGRGILRIEELRQNLSELLAEALYTRRLTSPTDDKNRARWPLHPLWTVAYQATPQAREMLPLGRQVTQAGDAIRRSLILNAAGNLRAAVVLHVGDYDEGTADEFIKEIQETIRSDPDQDKKVSRKIEQYRYVNTAKG